MAFEIVKWLCRTKCQTCRRLLQWSYYFAASAACRDRQYQSAGVNVSGRWDDAPLHAIIILKEVDDCAFIFTPRYRSPASCPGGDCDEKYEKYWACWWYLNSIDAYNYDGGPCRHGDDAAPWRLKRLLKRHTIMSEILCISIMKMNIALLSVSACCSERIVMRAAVGIISWVWMQSWCGRAPYRRHAESKAIECMLCRESIIKIATLWLHFQ